jgi:hypothetical protein
MGDEATPAQSRKAVIAGLGLILTGLFVLYCTALWGEGNISQVTGVLSGVCWAAGIAIIVFRNKPWLHDSTTKSSARNNSQTGEDRTVCGGSPPGRTLVWITVIVIAVFTLLHGLGLVLYALRLVNATG